MAIIKKWWKPALVLLVAIVCFIFACSTFKLVPAETEGMYKDIVSKFIESKDFSIIPYDSKLTINNTDSILTLEDSKSGAVLTVFYNLNPLKYVWNSNNVSNWIWRIILTLFMTFLISFSIRCIIELVTLFNVARIKRREKKIIKKDGDAYPVGYDIGYEDGFKKGRSNGYRKGIQDSRNGEYERGLEDGAEKAFTEVNDFDESEENKNE